MLMKYWLFIAACEDGASPGAEGMGSAPEVQLSSGTCKCNEFRYGGRMRPFALLHCRVSRC